MRSGSLCCEIELLYEQMQWITGSGSRSVMILAELKAFPIRMMLCAEFRCEIEEYLLRTGFGFRGEEN